jgi:hypothetical protein
MPAKPSDDPRLNKSFSYPLSKRDILTKAAEIARKQGIADDISNLIVNLITEFVQRHHDDQNTMNNNNPINITYVNVVTTANIATTTNNNTSVAKTLDEMLKEIDRLIEHMADTENNNLRALDYSRIQQYGKKLDRYAGNCWKDVNRKERFSRPFIPRNE